MEPMIESTFNHNDPKYKCCCGHIKTGFVVFLVLVILGACGSVVKLMQVQDFSTILGFVINLIVAISLCIAYSTQNAAFLYPYMIVIFFALPISIGVIFYVLVNSKELNVNGQSLAGTIVIVLVLANMLNMYFLSVVYQYYKYLSDLRKYRKSQKPVDIA